MAAAISWLGRMKGRLLNNGGLPVSCRSDKSRLKFQRFNLTETIDVAMGTVKWFNPEKGYGFIQPDDGGTDVFVHIRAVEKAGHSTLREGAKVSYEVQAGRSGKTSAENLRVG